MYWNIQILSYLNLTNPAVAILINVIYLIIAKILITGRYDIIQLLKKKNLKLSK